MSRENNVSADQSQVLTEEQESALLKPIDEHIGQIQKKIDALRLDGEEKIVNLKNQVQLAKENKALSKGERDNLISEAEAEIAKAKEVESKNKPEVDKLIAEAESYLKDHYESEYESKVDASCAAQKAIATAKYNDNLAALAKEHEANLAKLNSSDSNYKQEAKDENYVYKNKQFDAKMVFEKDLQAIKDRKHEAFTHKYHLIDLLRRSHFTYAERQAQSRETYRYTFNRKQFLLRNGLYIVIGLVFIILCIIAPVVKHTSLLTWSNVMNIMQQAAPRMFLALGVAGLILLTGTDLSIGRIVGMNMVIATVIMHKGINTGTVFGHIFDFTNVGIGVRALLALLICVICSVIFTSIAGFFTARFKIHPFVSTMSNMLIIFGLVTYGTKGVSFGAIESSIPAMIIPKIGTFPTIILWAVAAILVVWFIWNKTKFGKYLYAVGGNPDAAAVSGISVFNVTLRAFMMAGILYGFGAWLECQRMVGSGSAAYGQGWDMDAIAACVVGGVSFTGGIGKISGVVVGVMIFTALTYSLTILGIDTNLQFVFEGIIIIAAVTLDSLKYVQKK
jgi:methyl-galactoside transport system permease protein